MKKAVTLDLSSLALEDTSTVKLAISLKARALRSAAFSTDRISLETLVVQREEVCIFVAICLVVAVCSSTAVAMVSAASLS